MRKAIFIKLLSISVTADMFRRVQEIAENDNISSGQLVRSALDYALRHDGEWRKYRDVSEEVKDNDTIC
jgi:hypothetical protein